MQLFTEEFMERARMKTAYREGVEDGKLALLFDLVGQGQLTDDVASASIHMSVADFKQRMAEYDRARAR